MRAQFGDIQFTGLYGFGRLSEREETTFARHELASNKPRLQRVGWALDEKTIGIRLHSLFVDPEEKISELRAARIAGESMPLVYGNGDYRGNFVIEAMEIISRLTDEDGSLISADVSLDLVEHFDPNADQSEQVAAIRQALALDAANPVIYDRDGTLSEAALASRQYVAALAEADAIRRDAEEAALNASRRERAFERIVGRVRDFENGLEQFRTLILRGIDRYNNAQQMLDRAAEAIERANDVRDASLLGSVTGVQEATRNLRESIQAGQRASEPFIAQGAARQV